MILDRARRPMTAIGVALLILAVAALVAVAARASGSGVGLTCSGGYGCQTENPVLFTALGFAYRISMPLLVAGIVFLAGSQTIAALSGTGSTEMDGSIMTPLEPERTSTRRTIAVRLWVLAAALILVSTALGLWSASPPGQGVMMTSSGSSSMSLDSILFQLSYAIVPAGMLAGLLVAGLALIVTRARPLALRPAQSMKTSNEPVWDGKSHDPFMPQKHADEPPIAGS
jgi:hypothetical protein